MEIKTACPTLWEVAEMDLGISDRHLTCEEGYSSDNSTSTCPDVIENEDYVEVTEKILTRESESETTVFRSPLDEISDEIL